MKKVMSMIMAAMTLSVTGTGCAQAQEPSTKETNQSGKLGEGV